MNSVELSLLTWGFTAVIGFFIATMIWALPKLINKLHKVDKHHHPH